MSNWNYGDASELMGMDNQEQDTHFLGNKPVP